MLEDNPANITLYGHGDSTVYEQFKPDPVNDEMLRIGLFINYGIIVGIISITGLALNIMNIIVFISQGFGETINITLLGLSIADVGGQVTLVWMSLCYNPLVVGRLPQLDLMGIQHITAGWPHVCFTRISGWLTAFITFERYLCVALPLKIKSLLTRRRTMVIVILIYLVVLASIVPLYVAIHLAIHLDPQGNNVIGISYIPGGANLENIAVYCSEFFLLTSFVSVIVCTVGLVSRVNKTARWRGQATSALKSATVSSRDKKLVKMIITLAIVFIVSFMPVVVHLLAMMCEYEFQLGRKYQNLFLFCGTFVFNLEAINASSSIFVYLKMSSKFREVFIRIFCKRRNRG